MLLKPWSHIACDCDSIALRPKNLTIAERSQRSQKGFIEVAKRSPIGRRTKLVASCLLSMHKRLTATNLVGQRFHRLPRGLKEVYVSRRSVSNGAAIGFTTKRAGIFAM